MDYLVIDEKTLHKLQTFSHVEHMNEAVGIHKKMNRLTTTDRAILDVISRYACKYTGVCFLRKQLIAKKAGYKSRRTAIRSCQRLEQLGIIKQYETRRRAGDRRQAANLIVIQPVRSSGENSHTQDEQQIIAQENKFEQEHELAQNGLTQGQSHQTVTATSHPIKTSFKTPNEQKIQEDTYKETEKREICCDINEKDKSGTSNIIPDPWPDREKVQTVDTNDTLPYITNEE